MPGKGQSLSFIKPRRNAKKKREYQIPELKTPPHLGNNFDTTARRTKKE